MSSVKRYFDGRAMNYHAHSTKGFWSILRRKEENSIQNVLDPFPGMACLELGSGSGFYTRLLADCFPSRLVAVDLSYEMLSALDISGILKIQADIQNVSFRIRFDRILCAGALEFLPKPELFFHNIKHFLEKNGTLIVLLPSKGIMGQIYKLFHKSHYIKINLFDRAMLEAHLKQSCLKIDSIHKPTPMTYVLKVSHA